MNKSLSTKFLLLYWLILLVEPVKSQTWNSFGPYNFSPSSSAMGVINQLFYHPDHILYASSPDGGLWVCQNPISENPNWRPISDYVDNLEVRSFSVSMQNPERIFLLLNRNQIYVTNNMGQRWIRLSVNAEWGDLKVIKVDPANDQTIYLGTTMGIYKSVDGGTSFQLKFIRGEITDIAIDPSNNSIIYAGIRLCGLYKSLNHGDTWQLAQRSTVTEGNRPSKILVALGRMDSTGNMENHINRSILLKIGTNIYVSRNAGISFDTLQNISNDILDGSFENKNGGSAVRTNGIQKEWNNAVAIHPHDSRKLFVGQVKLYKSIDGTDNWGRENSDSSFGHYAGHEDIQFLAFSPKNPNLLFVANDGGVYRSEEDGRFEEFKKYFNGLVVAQFLRAGIQGNIIVVNADHNGVVGTDNYITNTTWQRAVGSEPCKARNNSMERNGVYADPSLNSRFFIFYDNLSQLRFPRSLSNRCNGDFQRIASFKPYPISALPNNPQGAILSVKTNCSFFPFINRNYIWVGSDIKDGIANFYYTKDGNKVLTKNDYRDSMPILSWEVSFSKANNPVVAAKYVEREKKLYCINIKGGLSSSKVSYNYSNKWRHKADFLEDGNPIFDFLVDRINSQIIYAITANSLFISNNGGDSWTEIQTSSSISTHSFYSITQLNNNNLLLATGNGVYKSRDYGSSWQKINGNLPNVKVLQLHIKGGNLIAITYGRGIWRIPISGI